jgi:hypothetical protein
MRKLLAVVSLAFVSTFVGSAAADEKPYKEGPVVTMGYIRVKDGKLNDYLSYLGGVYREEMEAEKKAGIILDWHVYQANPRGPNEPDLILTVTYPNFAAWDRTADVDAITTKVEGSLKKSDEGVVDRGSIRQILGGDYVQELILK